MPRARRRSHREGASNDDDGQKAERADTSMGSAADTSAEPTTTRGAVLPGWEPVGEALATRSWTVVEQCRVVGRDLAERGVGAREALRELRSTTRLVADREPSFDECEGLVDSWADATLGYLNRLTCADPLTGLDSQGHLLALLGAPVDTDQIMVVVQAPRPGDFLAHARQLTLLGELCRGIFPAARATARVGVRRLVVLTPANPDFGTRVALLARGVGNDATVWVEPVPPRAASAEAMVDRLARD
jgi:hypothetical protein